MISLRLNNARLEMSKDLQYVLFIAALKSCSAWLSTALLVPGFYYYAFHSYFSLFHSFYGFTISYISNILLFWKLVV